MPTFQIQLLGDFRLVYHDEPVTTLQQARSQSLLAYLLLHRDSPQSRQQLAFLFWPETSDAQALTNLRRELHHLRHSLPDADHYLQIDARSVQWRSNASFKLDVADFEDLLEQANQAAQAGRQAEVRTALAGALALYRGRLLPTCYEDWILPLRERLERRFERGLEQLILLLEEQRDYLTAIRYAQQMLHHDALHEPTYRRLMRLHALNGDRASALRVYHTCASMLQRELEVAPNQETQAAYARLLNLDAPQVAPAQTSAAGRTVARLVGRQPEWQQLRAAWRKAVQGQAHFVLVAGEAGIGKTRLAEELFESVSQQGIVTARTRSYAAEGARAYAPVIEWLRADRFRSTLDKLDDVWLTEVARLLPELLVERPALPRPEPLGERWQRQRLFEALARAVTGDGQPRLLLLDDLQWCDPETLEWLRYLLHYDLGAPLLIVGTVRAEETDATHPLTPLVVELRNSQQLTEIELGPLGADDTTTLAAQVAGQALAPVLTAQLYRETEGNPLFVVETVRAGVSKRAAGQAPPTTDALAYPRPPSAMPSKVQAVIQSRLAQLSSQARDLASLAATIGRSFTFDVLVRASDSSEDSLVRGLDELWQRGIVREQGGNAYDFSHDRIREVAYAEISPVRRRLLHRQVANALAALNEQNLDLVCGQLVLHYKAAGLFEQAIVFSQRAADLARKLFAYQEAINYRQQALHLLRQLPRNIENRQTEVELLLALNGDRTEAEGKGYPAIGEDLLLAYELLHDIGTPVQQITVLLDLTEHNRVRGNLGIAQELATEALAAAVKIGDRFLAADARSQIACTLTRRGNLEEAHTYYKQVQSALSSDSPSNNMGYLIRFAYCLWLLGFPEQALQKAAKSLELRREHEPDTLQVPLHHYSSILVLCRDFSVLDTLTAELVELTTRRNDEVGLRWGKIYRGWLLVQQGNLWDGIKVIRENADELRACSNYFYECFWRALLAEAYLLAFDLDAAFREIDNALAYSHESGDYHLNAQFLKLRGDCLQASNASDAEIEYHYQLAIDTARKQKARSLELRATTSLCCFWQKQGKQAEARQLLAAIYGWFSEGFDTPDLHAAKTLLDALPEHP